jgi:hypothetical protein
MPLTVRLFVSQERSELMLPSPVPLELEKVMIAAIEIVPRNTA